jgi:hypothetical protein
MEKLHSPSQSRQRQNVIVFSKTFGTVLGPTQPALLSRGSNDEYKNGWSCTSFPLHAFVAWTATFLCAYLILKAFFLQRELRWGMRELTGFHLMPVAIPALRHTYIRDIEDSSYEK